MRAVYNKFSFTSHGGRISQARSAPIRIGSAIGDAVVLLAQALPYALVLAGLLIAYAGIQRRHIRLSSSLTLTEADARSLGRFALYAALTIASVLFWTRTFN